jgi:anti-sigma regulatory factor (Ser/Thr protein kinase)
VIANAELVRTAQRGRELALVLANDVKALEPGRVAMRDFLERQGVSEHKRYDAELVLEELFTNIVRYGYRDKERHDIRVTFQLSSRDIEMTFDDDGEPFDVTQAADPTLPESIEEAKIGGLGIMLVRKAAREMAYRRENGHNVLSVHLALE